MTPNELEAYDAMIASRDQWRERAERLESLCPSGAVPCSASSGIEAAVCEDIAKRQKLGIQKYGVTVANNPLALREWLQHAYEECLDQAVYLKRAMAELDHFPAATKMVTALEYIAHAGLSSRHMEDVAREALSLPNATGMAAGADGPLPNAKEKL